MKERDCTNCKHHTSDGCSSWDCEFEAKDLISRADAIDACCRGWNNTAEDCIRNIKELPSAELPKGDLISRADALRELNGACSNWEDDSRVQEIVMALPSADTVQIHEDGTLEAKVPNAQKVGRVLVMDTDSHIGGGLFYPDDADAEWIPVSDRLPNEDECGWYLVTVNGHELFVDVAPFIYELWEGLASHQKVIAWMPLPAPYRKDSEA